MAFAWMSIFPMTLRFTSSPKRLRKIVYPTCTSSAIYVHFFLHQAVCRFMISALTCAISTSVIHFSLFFLFTIPQIGSLIIESTRKKDSGNYSCSPSNSPPITVSLHVINGKSELGTMANCRSTWFHTAAMQISSLPVSPYPAPLGPGGGGCATGLTAISTKMDVGLLADRPAQVHFRGIIQQEFLDERNRQFSELNREKVVCT